MFKKLLAAVALVSGLAFSSHAQSNTYHYLSNPSDTTTTGGAVVIYNYVTNTDTANLVLKWRIIGIDNPNNWGLTGFCDYRACYGDSATLNGLVRTDTIVPNNTPDLGRLMMDVDVPVDASTGHLQVRVLVSYPGLGETDTLVYNVTKTAAPTSVSVVKANDKRVSISPNPGTDNMVVFADKSLNASKIAVVNLVGQVVYTTEIAKASENTTINISGLAKGTYIVNIADNKGQMVTARKFVKN